MTLSLNVEITGAAFYLRIDPSVRVGVIQISQIQIAYGTSGIEILSLSSKNAWQQVTLGGTAKWLRRRNAYCLIGSFGNDPQIILPVLKKGLQEKKVNVKVKLKTMCYSQAMELFCLDPFNLLRLLKNRLFQEKPKT